MKLEGTRRRRVVLALVLLVAGGGFLWLGLRGLGIGRPTVAEIVATPTPEPTATEPILPPRPTGSPTPAVVAASTYSPAGEAGGTAPAEESLTSPPLPATQAAETGEAPAPVETASAASPDPTAGLDVSPGPTPAGETASSPTDQPGQSRATATVDTSLEAYSTHQRLGICAAGVPITRELAARLGLGWYLDWSAGPDRYHSAEVEYVPMIRLRDGKRVPDGQALMDAVDAQPGALWLIGNEPDVKWQDNVAADVYAQAYHDLYLQLKDRDPTCQVAIGGVSQPTPLRLRYLDQILDAYRRRYDEPMPVDVWNVHNFILREELDSWGVDIPPGMPDRTGRLREIADHDDLRIFRQQIEDFRQWMKDRGQQDKPLIVTEYGILMPTDYGFPPQEVEQFMLATFDYFNTAADPALGNPSDGYRLVQRWCWYSLADERYPTGDLIDAASGALTPLGKAFQNWATSAH